MTELPPRPKMSPRAIMTVNTGVAMATPATMFVLPVCAMK